MTLLHGTMTGAEVDALRIPLKKKLTAISDLPGHIVAFRGTLGRLATVGQAPLELDVYRWFLATLSPFPVFQQYTLLFTVANGAIAQQTFEAYAACVLPQLHNILAHSNPRPFARNLEGHEDEADKDIMTGDVLYPKNLTPCTLPSTLPNNNCTLPNTITLLPTALTLRHNYPHLLALAFHLTHPTPWPMQCTPTHLPQPLPLPMQRQVAQDREARSKENKATRHRRKRRRAPLPPPSHALLSCVLPRCISTATTMAG